MALLPPGLVEHHGGDLGNRRLDLIGERRSRLEPVTLDREHDGHGRAAAGRNIASPGRLMRKPSGLGAEHHD